MKIYLVRHGQTLFNLKHRIQGWCDSFLTDLGIEQAKALGVGLKDTTIDVAYSSTSERAIDTAKYIIGDRNIELNSIKGLKEIHFGSLEGEYEKDCLASDGSSHDKGFVEFGGETLAMCQARMNKTINDIVHKHPDQDVVIVTHGGAIMCALLSLFEMEVSYFRSKGNHIENCSISIIEYIDNEYNLISISDTSYIERGMKGVN